MRNQAETILMDSQTILTAHKLFSGYARNNWPHLITVTEEKWSYIIGIETQTWITRRAPNSSNGCVVFSGDLHREETEKLQVLSPHGGGTYTSIDILDIISTYVGDWNSYLAVRRRNQRSMATRCNRKVWCIIAPFSCCLSMQTLSCRDRLCILQRFQTLFLAKFITRVSSSIDW